MVHNHTKLCTIPKAYVWKIDDQSEPKSATTGSCTAQTLQMQCLGTPPGGVWLAAEDTDIAGIDPPHLL